MNARAQELQIRKNSLETFYNAISNKTANETKEFVRKYNPVCRFSETYGEKIYQEKALFYKVSTFIYSLLTLKLGNYYLEHYNHLGFDEFDKDENEFSNNFENLKEFLKKDIPRAIRDTQFLLNQALA